jgi:hypothetical protein
MSQTVTSKSMHMEAEKSRALGAITKQQLVETQLTGKT